MAHTLAPATSATSSSSRSPLRIKPPPNVVEDRRVHDPRAHADPLHGPWREREGCEVAPNEAATARMRRWASLRAMDGYLCPSPPGGENTWDQSSFIETNTQPFPGARSSAWSSRPRWLWRSYAYSRTPSSWCRTSPSRRPGSPVVHCSICKSPSELPKARIGRRPMWRWMPTGLPSLSSTNASFSPAPPLTVEPSRIPCPCEPAGDPARPAACRSGASRSGPS